VRLGDVIRIDLAADHNTMSFTREAEGLTPMFRPNLPASPAAARAPGRVARRFDFPLAAESK
jgi:hypothetical protein